MARNKLANFQNTRMLVVGAIVMLASLGMIYAHFTREKIASPSDLKTVRGPFLDCLTGTRGNYCDISLQADYDKYQIPADFLRSFDRQSFDSTVHSGDPLTLLVNRKLVVFSVSDKDRNFLNVDSTIAIYNGGLDLWKGMFLFLIGGGCVAWAVVADRNRP